MTGRYAFRTGNEGFDEWFGIPNSSDESFWPDNPLFDPASDPFARLEYLMQGRKGGKPENVRVYDSRERLLIDAEITDRTIDFMKRQKGAECSTTESKQFLESLDAWQRCSSN